MKTYSIYVLLADLPAARCEFKEVQEGHSPRLAINEALKRIMANPKVKGHQLKSGKVSWTLIKNEYERKK